VPSLSWDLCAPILSLRHTVAHCCPETFLLLLLHAALHWVVSGMKRRSEVTAARKWDRR
jgi:hypothetical protein